MFIPKRIIVKKRLENLPKAQEVIKRCRLLNSTISVEDSSSDEYKSKIKKMTALEKWNYRRESVSLSNSTVPFITTFASPGKIVEDIGTILNVAYHCAYNCEFCYLQGVLPYTHTIYTNIDKLEQQVRVEPYFHCALLSLWSTISFNKKETLLKIPHRFNYVANSLRKIFNKNSILSDQDAVDLLFQQMESENLYNLFLGKKKLKIEQTNKNKGGKNIISKQCLKVTKKELENYYNENKKYTVRLNTSEYCDFLAIDHLAGNTALLMKLLQQEKNIKLGFRTKSANVEELLKYDGDNRVNIAINFNTEYIINVYEHGTASLNERLEAAVKIQQSKGFALKIVIEPILIYPNWVVEYRNLISIILNTINPANVIDWTFATVRYGSKLKSIVKRNFPLTNLFINPDLLNKIDGDPKYRYCEQSRFDVYYALLNLLKQASPKAIVRLGAESEVLWDRLGLDKQRHLGKSVFQYNEEHEFKGKNIKMVDEDNEEEINEYENGSNNIVTSNALPLHVMAGEVENEGWNYLDFDKSKDVVDCLEQITSQEIEAIQSIRIREAIDGDHSFQPIQIVGFLVQEGIPIPMRVNGQLITVVKVKIIDLNNESINCFSVPIQLINKIKSQRTKQSLLLKLFGAIIPINVSQRVRTPNYKYRFLIVNVSEFITAEDLINYRPTKPYEDGFGIIIQDQVIGIPQDHPYLILEKHKSTNGVIDFIKNKIVENFKIIGLENIATELDCAIEFMILQAFSQGRGDYSHKLHSLAIGPANYGKRFLTMAALMLNPIGQEILASNAKVTPAGLVGAVKATRRGNVSEGGILPSNSGGVVCIQDFHALTGGKRKELFALFSKFMEEGEIMDTTSANTLKVAETSLHLDMNRPSQNDRSGMRSSLKEIDIPNNILSRLDFIIEFPDDDNVRDKIATDWREEGIMEGSKPHVMEDWEIELKMLVAFMRTNYTNALFTPKINKIIDETYEKLLTQYPEIKTIPEYHDMAVRMKRSFYKIVKAIVCANGTYEVKEEFVEYASKFVNEKLKFINSIRQSPVVAVEQNENIKRQNAIVAQFGGQTVGTGKIVEYLTQSTRVLGIATVSRKTVTDDLHDIKAKNVKRGYWAIPSATKG